MKTTKKTITFFLFVLTFLTVTESFCQFQKFGIKAGLNFSSVSIGEEFDPYPGKENKLGFNIFASYDLLNLKNLSLSAETGYIQKGFKYKAVVTNAFGEIIGEETIEHKLNYLDLSVNAKFMLRYKSVSPYISITPTAGFFLGNSMNISGAFDSLFQNYKDPVLDSLNSVSFGIKLGAGVELSGLIKKVPLTFEVRYNPDIIKSYDNYGVKLKNNTIEINLGAKF